MKVYGWRHKENRYSVWLCDSKDGADEMLRDWLLRTAIYWDERHKYFEEIEAEITYEDEGF